MRHHVDAPRFVPRLVGRLRAAAAAADAGVGDEDVDRPVGLAGGRDQLAHAVLAARVELDRERRPSSAASSLARRRARGRRPRPPAPPRATKRRTSALPMPPAPPVTTMCLSRRSIGRTLCHRCHERLPREASSQHPWLASGESCATAASSHACSPTEPCATRAVASDAAAGAADPRASWPATARCGVLRHWLRAPRAPRGR